jgi:hypothetical protein
MKKPDFQTSVRLVILLFIVLAPLYLFFYPTGILTPQKNYNVTIRGGVLVAGATIDGVKTTTPSIILTNGGGKDTVDLQYVSVSINGKNVSDIRPYNGGSSLYVDDEGIYPVTDANNNHVIAVGHFSDGVTKVLLDTTI